MLNSRAKQCNAKSKRSGVQCRNNAVSGKDKCRMHGGKSTGPKDPTKLLGNKNSVTTGEYETIWKDQLREDENNLYDKINTDVLVQLEEEIKLLTIRERRMLERIKDLADKNMIEIGERETISEMNGSEITKEKKSALEQIQNIEEALTRVQEKKQKLLDLKHKIESNNQTTVTVDMTPYLEALGATNVEELWEDEEEEENEEEEAE